MVRSGFFFMHETAYEMRISDWSSDVCSSDLLARRGAKVVVNDLGGSRDGTGHSDAALQVVEEIRAAGGTAMPNGGSVTEYEQMAEMVAKAKAEWGGFNVLINTPGILREKSFAKMEPDDFTLALKVDRKSVG